jgi:gluconokinase
MESKKDCILTVNIGTIACKLIAYDYSGNEIISSKGSYPTFHPHPDWSEQDPEQIFITLMFLLKGILNDVAFTSQNKVQSIVLSSAMHSLVPLDANGNTLGNAIIWSDNRASDIADKLKATALGNQLYQRTGTPIHAMSPFSKISWLCENDQLLFKKASKFVSIKEYLTYQLTGEFYVDYSLASATGLFNLKDFNWDSEAMKIANIDASYLSNPVDIFNSELKIKKHILKSLRLDKSTALIIGSTDGCLATLSAGSLQKDQAVMSITSSSAVRVFCEESLVDDKGSFFNYILDKKLLISGGPSNNGGVAFEWAARTLGRNSIDRPMEEVLNSLLNDAAKVKEGAEGLLFLPYLQGERAPLWNSNARGVYFGINITHEPRHIARATLEGILYELYSISKSIKKHRDFKSLHLNGYNAMHPLWSNIICDLHGMPVTVSTYKHSSNIGAAMVGLTAMGVFSSIEKAMEIAPAKTNANPNKDKNKVYAKYYSLFERLTNKLAGEFDEIAKLQNDY